MKQFNNKAILTTKNPEAFLNFTFDINGSEYWIIPDCSITNDFLYVNGLDINDYSPSIGYALKLDATNNIASFHVYSNINYNFDANINFTFYNTYNISSGTSDVSTHDVSILNRPYILSAGAINNYNNNEVLVDDEASYLILRTNPKFTGNIKIRVNEDNKIYLDTFQISDTLSNRRFRKQQVSGNSVLSSDVRNVFSSLPQGEIFKMDKDTFYSTAIPKTEYKDQYNTAYNYGARLIKDELYSEDNGILAPLWINSKLPDYFAVFRLSGVYNQETYTDRGSLVNLAFKYLEESNIAKTWSLKPDAPLGQYLLTHLNDTIKYQAPVFLSLSDPDANESDPNTWHGIAVDKGVVTGRSETTYFFDQNANNYTSLNAFVSQGFERNNLLCSNLLNLEYVFSDEDVSLYSMHRYFGLYLTENVLYNIAYYSDVSGYLPSIISLDGKDSSVFFNSTIFDSSGNIATDYKNRIFVLNDGETLTRITNVNQVNGAQLNDYASSPYKNIFSATIEKTNINPFITITLNAKLEQGEHLRIINSTQQIIWEVYGVSASSYPCEKYCTVSENLGFYTVYRTYFDVDGDLYDQILEIEQAFDRFGDYDGTYFRAGLHGSDWVSIILNDDAVLTDVWSFQRITASTRNIFMDTSTAFNNAGDADAITFFGRFTPNASDFEVVSYDAIDGPIDFELYGDRQRITLNLFDRGSYNLYSFDSIQNIVDKIEEPTLYQDTTTWYRKILGFDVSNNTYQYVKDPLHMTDKVLIMTEADINTYKSSFNAYSIHKLNISLMGINPVKDIDYTVYDVSLGFNSEYLYKRSDDISTYYISLGVSTGYTLDIPGSYVIQSGIGTLTQNAVSRNYDVSTIFNTFDTSIRIDSSTATLITYAVLDGTYDYESYISTASNPEESINDYYLSNSLLKYSLTAPLNSKWVGLGSDCRNNPFRLILNDTAVDISTNFIPTSNNFSQEVSYPVFKYLTPGARAWESYLFYDINDVIYDGSTYLTFKEAMFAYPYVDYFSKLVYSNNNVNNKKARSSIVYYNGYKSTLDTIITGVNLSVKVENAAKSIIDIKAYDRYRFSLISTPSKNRNTYHPIEIIINENTQTILMIWYQGNDELNYNKRYSTFLPGKSLLDASSYGFVSGRNQKTYSFVKTPFFVNNSIIAKALVNVYDNNATYDSSTVRPYAQFNKSINNINSTWNAFTNRNSLSDLIFNLEESYNTFAQYVNYTYIPNNNTWGDYVLNYGYNYNTNNNWYASSTTNIDTLNYLLSPSYRYVMTYIIRGSERYSSYDFGTSPITVFINPPREYGNVQTYNGWFKPKFNSILEFNANEESELINVVERDFTFSNTDLRLYNNIPQLWYNKLVTTVSQADVDTGKAISHLTDFNVFKTLWDARYYIKDGLYVNGYNSPDELPSFFGSKLVKLPDDIIVGNWDITTAAIEQTTTSTVIKFNLSRAILNMFKTNVEFTKNWTGLTGTDNIKDSYIKNTILTYYNISQSKIKVGFYYKPYDSQLLYFTYDDNFISDGKQNFNGQLLYENDEYIYKIVIPRTGYYSYFVNFTMTEK